MLLAKQNTHASSAKATWQITCSMLSSSQLPHFCKPSLTMCQVLYPIIKGCSADSSVAQVCAAACACIQSLSGSMKCLRELSMAHLTPPVVRLLSRSEPEVQLTALKALTNLMLDADSAKVCHHHAGLESQTAVTSAALLVLHR